MGVRMNARILKMLRIKSPHALNFESRVTPKRHAAPESHKEKEGASSSCETVVGVLSQPEAACSIASFQRDVGGGGGGVSSTGFPPVFLKNV